MPYSRWFIRFNYFSLLFLYLVIVAGSVVRTSGSGMGCPDWPKCFGSWVPPTQAEQLPSGIQEKLLDKRLEKAERFSRLLRNLGMKETADKLMTDPFLGREESFNVRRTWTEYINRLVGFVAGNLVMVLFFWTLLKYRSNKKLVLFTFANLILISFEGWFGSIVVASNLVPWTITVHLFFALIIVGIQVYLINEVSYKDRKIQLSKPLRNLLLLSLVITFGQMFLGTQVREYIDELTRNGFGRNTWADQLGWVFFVHRTFSWLVLFLLGYLAYMNEKSEKVNLIRASFVVLSLELVSGVLLAYLDLPAISQVVHLLLATVILGLLWLLWLRRNILLS